MDQLIDREIGESIKLTNKNQAQSHDDHHIYLNANLNLT